MNESIAVARLQEEHGVAINSSSSNQSTSIPATRLATALFVYLLITMICGGATCARKRSALPEFNPPPVFTKGTPTLEDVITQTNRSLAIKSLSSNSLTINSPELSVALSGNFRWERPDRFRLETKLFSAAMGVPLAAGSNSELFWLQTSRPTPTIYYANHQEFDHQAGGRHILPVSPLWLREAFGIIELDPQMEHQGPVARSDGKLEVTSFIPSSRGNYRRILVLAPTTGTIEETRVYDANGKLIAIANMLQHQYYSSINWSLPHQVQIRLIPDVGDEIVFKIDVGYYQTNESFAAKLFDFPNTTGLKAVDLVRLNSEQVQQVSQQDYQQQQQSIQGYTAVAGNGAWGQTPMSPLNSGGWTPANGEGGFSEPANLPVAYSNTPANSPTGIPQAVASPAGTSPAITSPVYRTSTQPVSMQNWQGNLRR